MAALVSHAMHRFPTSPPDAVYSSYSLRGEPSRTKTPYSGGGGESALSRSMRYADPWLYGSVRAGNGLLLAPAFVLCTCQDYVNGTKRSKKGPTTCKKCKGTRLPLSSVDSKFGTVRCYPTQHPSTPQAASTPLRAGTVRVSSSTRASILPAADPYDLMRRSRLAVAESSGGSQYRTRSVSPGKPKNGDVQKSKGSKNQSYNSTFGRRSILECDINPYDLIASSDPTAPKPKDASITLVNGQRIRVRPRLADDEYEEVEVRKPVLKIPMKEKAGKVRVPVGPTMPAPQPPQSPKPPNPNENEADPNNINRFKSILKKPSTFGDTDSINGRPEPSTLPCSPSPVAKSGSHFYIPTPSSPSCGTPRKKVQFLVEKENRCLQENGDIRKVRMQEEKEDEEEEDDVFEDALDEVRENGDKEDRKNDATKERKEEKSNCKLQRSHSERLSQDQRKVIFHDTMALRNRKRSDSRITFADQDLERLDGLTSRTRKISPDKPRPNVPPPPPPQSQNKKEKEPKKKISFDESVENYIKTSSVKDKNEVNVEKSKEYASKPEESSGYKLTRFPKNKVVDTTKKPTESENKHKERKALERLDLCLIAPKSPPIIECTPPSAPPRKRSNNKQPFVNIQNTPTVQSVKIETSPILANKIIKVESPTPEFSNHIIKVESPTPDPSRTIKIDPPTPDFSNRTVVLINGSQAVHKLQIKNEFTETSNVQTVAVADNPQRKTSILINGDDCYSTVNVNDDVPLYQSSVVVKDTNDVSPLQTIKKSSLVYISGTFVASEPESKTETPRDTKTVDDSSIDNQVAKETANKHEKAYNSLVTLNSFNETNIPSSELLKELLRDPVEAVRRNLVPHVCGKSDVPRRPRKTKLGKLPSPLLGESLLESPLEENNISSSLEDSFLRLRNYESLGDDVSSEHSSSTQYELMDGGSDCYTDNSNRSSVTEEELANRTKFYELLADASHIEVSENEDHHYESIKVNSDPIYEEIEIPPPLPSNPPPSSLIDDLQLDKEYTTRSIFEGASKYDILSYLVDAKDRIVQEEGYAYNFPNHSEETKEPYNRVCHMSTVSDSSEDSSLIMSGNIIDDKATFQKPAEVERNDSGVGSETSKSSLSKYRTKQEISISCEDCETVMDSKTENEPLICRKCIKKRSERKEIITEIVETEEKYSKDLQIILEEFYQPMLVAGLLTPEQLAAIFLNAEELLENSQALAERLRDAVEIALEQGDDDLLTVNIGKLFLEAAPMLHAFETYCIRQGAASLLLASLEKDKELLRIFLKVSQMENTMLRRMNLNSFLMVPVQRVTKYPLLLARLYKVTPSHHETREQLKEAQHKIELHLNHMNSETKDVPSKLWRRIGSSSGRRSSTEMDLVNIKLRKIAVDVLEWNHDEAKFALEGKLLFTQPTDNNWRKGRTIKLSPVNALLVINGKTSSTKSTERTDENGLIFSRQPGVREAALLLVRDKNGRYSLLREPLYLDRCVIAADPAWQSYFEVQELLGKDTFIFKAEDEDQTSIWYKQLQYHAQGMGAWRKRRNALANIMINGMGLRS